MWRTSNWLSRALIVLASWAWVASPAFAKPKSTAHAGAKESGAAPAERVEMPMPNEVAVSDRDFNHFVFPGVIATGPIFPAGSPILGKPVYLAGNTQILLQLAPHADKPVNMIVELQGGAVYKLWLRPRPIPGITYRVDGARELTRETRHLASVPANPRDSDLDLLKHVVTGDLPDDFQRIDLPPPTRFDKFTVVPLSGWSDGSTRRVMTFALVAVPGQTAVVAPPQFYRPGITAVLIDGDIVDASKSPTLYVTEEIGTDE